MSAEAESFALVLGRVEGKLDVALSRQADHEQRIRCLERQKWFERGIASATGVAAAALVNLLKP